ncbi:hypothetical protein D9V37_12430 [Nocardioides mangrovicus]|uniref:Sulfotransferase family protein n=1 Tax=Nocardioides mangrovicus TaxID=2478913 RepID=A0A3L8P1L8_9ACTN|nr:hypothetical protein [Nocardioides mangrovicus]RLV49340.1 hypothetical protein D9V37_12430 [Nocardioides mangrovicus]
MGDAGGTLYFWHIPKTAGTTLTQWLEAQYRPEEVYRPHLLPDLRGTAAQDLLAKRLFRGHFGSELPRRLPVSPTTVTVLREPRARTVSHLGHIWRTPDHYLHRRLHAAGERLPDVLADPVLRRAVSDVQARYLGRTPPRRGPRRPLVTVSGQLLAQAEYELAPVPGRARLRRRAARRLGGMGVVGVTDRIDDLAYRLATRLGWSEPDDLSRANAAPSGASPWSGRRLQPAERSLLDDVNRVDADLYRLAQRLT